MKKETVKTQLHSSRIATMLRTEVVAVRNEMVGAFLKKPASGTGLWTSTWRPETQDSAWVEWCSQENFGDPFRQQWFLLEPLPETRLYIVRGEAEMAALLRDYSWVDEHIKSYYDVCSPFASPLFSGIDFELLSQHYDGLHLTEEGNELLHFSLNYGMNAWDAESTVWFRWCFSPVQKIEPPLPKEEAIQQSV